MMIKLSIAGAAGRMGQSLVRAAIHDDKAQLIGGTERAGSAALGQDLGLLAKEDAQGCVAVDTVQAAAGYADVWIDFTAPAPTLGALEALKETSVKAVVIGTTGFTIDEEQALLGHAKRIPIVKAGNFSLGVNLVTALVEQAAKRLGPDWDIEVLETHHRRKVDAPSGTALMMGEAAAAGRGVDLSDVRTAPYDGLTGAREPGKIGFSVRRAGGVIGDHETLFASENELVSLRHTAMDRSIFANGAIYAARWAIGKQPGLYDMRDVLEL